MTNASVSAITASGSTAFAATSLGDVFVSTNNGVSWTSASNIQNNANVFALAISGANICVATSKGIFLSTNNGTNWNVDTSGLANSSVYSLLASGANLFAGTVSGGVFLSIDNGKSWNALLPA